ncbi:hypothetical protein H8959_005972 [Pygathrix nigripes]
MPRTDHRGYHSISEGRCPGVESSPDEPRRLHHEPAQDTHSAEGPGTAAREKLSCGCIRPLRVKGRKQDPHPEGRAEQELQQDARQALTQRSGSFVSLPAMHASYMSVPSALMQTICMELTKDPVCSARTWPHCTLSLRKGCLRPSLESEEGSVLFGESQRAPPGGR